MRSVCDKATGLQPDLGDPRPHPTAPYANTDSEVDTPYGARVVEELTSTSFSGVDIALFSAGGSQSRKFAPAAVEAGAVVVDNSSAFRMDPNVPLVVPEINADAVRNHAGIVANPNCSTIIMNVAVWPLAREFGVERIACAT